MAESNCTNTTLRQAFDNNRRDILSSTLGAAGTGLVLYAERNGETAVIVGSVALFLKEFNDFSKSMNSRYQLNKFDGLNPDTPIQSCMATNTLAATLGFQSVKILKPMTPKLGGSVSSKLGVAPLAPGALDQSLLDRLHRIPSSALAPQTAVPGRPETSTASAVFPAWWTARTGAFAGRVLDANSGLPVSTAYVTLLRLSEERGATSGELTQRDGSFRFEYLPEGQYLLSVSDVAYSGSSVVVNVPGSIDFHLHGKPIYPCKFTVFNMTGWQIVVGTGSYEAQPSTIAPYSSFTGTLSHPDQFFARAQLVGSAITWGPIQGTCTGPGFIKIVP
jgi:hypothetical protein